MDDPALLRPDERIVVVGGGATGGMLARTLHKAGWSGQVVLLTAEPHAPYDRTMLSKAALLGEVDEPRPLLPDDLDRDDTARGTLDLRLATTVTRIDRDRRVVVTADGDEVAFDWLVLAPGGRARALDLPGSDLDFVHTVRERAAWGPLRDLVRAGSTLAVIGAGLIGLEVAAAAIGHGGSVTVIELADRVLGRVLPTVLADEVADEHRRQGVTLRTGVAPTAIVDATADQPRGVRLADDTFVEADAVLLAVGSRPRLGLARDAGLDVDDAILVDEHLRTSDPRIHAAGDAVRIVDDRGHALPRTESWTPAAAMGQRIARNLLGDPRPYRDVPWMWSDQYDLQIQAVGVPVEGLDTVQRGSVDGPEGLVVFGVEDDHVLGAAGLSRGRGVGRTVRAAQRLIERDVTVRPEQLADPEVDLRGLAR